MNQFQLLSQNPLFKDIAQDEIMHLYHCLEMKKKDFHKGDFIFLQNQKVNHLGILINGRAQIIQEDYLGNRTVIRQLIPNSLFGEAFVCAQVKELTVSVQAQCDSTVFFVSLDKILGNGRQTEFYHQVLIRNLVTILANKNLLLLNKLEVITKRSLQEKILAYLNQLAQEQHRLIVESPLGRIDLADFLGVDRSSLTRELNKMQEMKLLSFKGNVFQLLNRSDYSSNESAKKEQWM